MVIAYIFGFFFFMIPLEILIRQQFMSNYLIEYPKSGKRMDNMKKMFSKIPLSKQAYNVFHSLFGVTSIVNGITGYYLLSYFISFNGNINPGTVKEIIIQLVLMNLLGDFFLYWGHR
jgi:sterol desaturase/sphingolipid hydroxylase (fatty acid hydroxylase superfamily)